MKITLGKLSESFGAVEKLSAKDLGEPLLNFKLMNVLETIESSLKKHQKVCEGIIKKYSTEKSENGFIVQTDKIKLLNEELEKAANIEIDLDWKPIEADIKELKGFTAKDLKMLVGTFITIKESEESD